MLRVFSPSVILASTDESPRAALLSLPASAVSLGFSRATNLEEAPSTGVK